MLVSFSPSLTCKLTLPVHKNEDGDGVEKSQNMTKPGLFKGKIIKLGYHKGLPDNLSEFVLTEFSR